MRRAILIADDNEAVRRAIRHMLEKHLDCQVCGEADNGRDAIEKGKELRPDLVVLDFSMPVMNGLEAARILKRERPGTPLVLFTMFKDKRLEEEAFAAGISLVIAKEDGVAQLAECTEVLLKYSASTDQPLPPEGPGMTIV